MTVESNSLVLPVADQGRATTLWQPLRSGLPGDERKLAEDLDDNSIIYRATPPPVWPRVFPGL
ncbi:hypothetical protein D3C83_215200 [compost metagenome]